MLLIYLIAFFNISFLYAGDFDLGEIIVESSKDQVSWSDMGANAVVISHEEIDSEENFLNVLRSSGVEVTQSGVNGNSAIYLRGFSGKHTIVMIDGVPVNDVSNPSGEFNASYLSNLNIERVEILKGAQSVLHGGALAGIINIITKKVEGKNKLSVSYGSYEYLNSNAVLSGEVGGAVYHLSGNYEKQSGPSEALRGVEDDHFKKVNTTLNLNYEIGQKMTGQSYFQVSKASQDFDDASSVPVDDINNHAKTSMIMARQSLEYVLDSKFSSMLDLSLVRNQRNYQGSWVSNWNGNQARLESRNYYKVGRSKTLFGFTLTEDQVQSDDFNKKISQFDFFVKNTFKLDGYILEAGARQVNHQSFGQKNLFQASVLKKIQDISLSLNWGTSFRAPSIGELYTPVTGNEDLLPEDSHSWELNMKKEEKDRHTGLSFFKQKLNQEIIFSGSLINQGEYEIRGVEFEQAQSLKKLKLRFNLSYNDLSQNRESKPLRRAYLRSALFSSYALSDFREVLLKYRYAGQRSDRSGGDTYELGEFHLWDLGYKFSNKAHALSFQIKNLFNKSYQEIYGYQTLKRNFLMEYEYFF